MPRTVYAAVAYSLGLALFITCALQVVAIVGQPFGWAVVVALAVAAVPVLVRASRAG